MPSSNFIRSDFYEALGKIMSDENFDELCFQVGIELDEVTNMKEIISKEQGEEKAKDCSEEVIYKIEVPANRYDLVCQEGLILSLRAYLELSPIPNFTTKFNGEKIHIKPSVKSQRPYILCAVLRNIKLDEKTLTRFIEFQEKLDSTICKKRRIVAIGTYDLDTVQGPFTYEAVSLEQVKFQMLKRSDVMVGDEIIKELKNDPKLKQYCNLMDGWELYPLIRDSNGTVLSMPPMINSENTRVTVNTKNLFLDVTGFDLEKMKLVLTTILCLFSTHCEEPYTIESVLHITEENEFVFPEIKKNKFKTDKKFLNTYAGTDFTCREISKLLTKMGHETEILNEHDMIVSVPIFRFDVLHPCDLAEDLAVAYGFNNIKKIPPMYISSGQQQYLNKLSDILRGEMAFAGYVECLNFCLLSMKEQTEYLYRNENLSAVTLLNSKTPEFEQVRTSLIPGILKTIAYNNTEPIPFKLFELSDIVLLDNSDETGAKNFRRLCFAYVSQESAFEIIHGRVDAIMNKLGLQYKTDYVLKPANNPTFFEGRQANIFLINETEEIYVGTLGIIHPKVLKNFNVKFCLVTLAEIEIEVIFKYAKI